MTTTPNKPKCQCGHHVFGVTVTSDLKRIFSSFDADFKPTAQATCKGCGAVGPKIHAPTVHDYENAIAARDALISSQMENVA